MSGTSLRELLKRTGETLDPANPPKTNRLGGNAVDPDADDELLDWYESKSQSEDASRRLRQAIVRYTHEPAALATQDEKTVTDLLRRTADQRRTLSVREIERRHDDPTVTTHRMLWYNTWLLDGVMGIAAKPEYKERRHEIGRAIAHAGYDVAGLCEVFDTEERDAIAGELPSSYEMKSGPGDDNVFQNSSGLQTLVNEGHDRRLRSFDRREYGAEGGGWDSMANKGIAYAEIDLAPNADDRRRIDFFTTHLHATEKKTRKYQLNELVHWIHYKSEPENVTIVAGDFNVDGRKSEYRDLLEKMHDPLGTAYTHPDETSDRKITHHEGLELEDVWLTRGGKRGSTHEVQDFDAICPFDTDDGPPYYCKDDYGEVLILPDPGTPTDAVPGYRLDYIFVERPQDAHTFNLDVSRVRRRPFWREPFSRGSYAADEFYDDPGSESGPNFMSDHLGLELTLLASPKE